MKSHICTFKDGVEQCSLVATQILCVKKPSRKTLCREVYCDRHTSFRRWQYRSTYVRVVRVINLSIPKEVVNAVRNRDRQPSLFA